MPQPAGPRDAEAFVGRSRELALLSAALRQAVAGDARLALISGEPGIGKTELARAFARAAAKAGPQAAVLAQLLSELGAAQELTGSGDAARLTLFDAVGAVLDRASRAAPVLLATYRTAEAAVDPDVSDVIVQDLVQLAAAAHLDQSVRTGTRCSYSPPDHPG